MRKYTRKCVSPHAEIHTEKCITACGNTLNTAHFYICTLIQLPHTVILYAAYHRDQSLTHFYFFYTLMISLSHRPPPTSLFLLMILISFSHKDPVQQEKLINNELKKISNWFKENELSLNIDKTNFMIFKNKHNDKADLHFK